MRTLLLHLGLFLVTALQSQTFNHYFGNLHAHTAFSDGNKDSLTSGVGRPDGSYSYAKLSTNFDFLGISEHNHYSSPKNPGFKLPLYQTGLTMANAANQDGIFLALFGLEYGVSSDYNGHIITYGFNQLIGWETGVPGVAGNNYDIYNAKTDYDAFFKKVKNNAGAFCYLAHPNTNDYTTDGTAATALANAPYNATYDSAIVGTPLRSGIAFSTFSNYSDYSTGNYFGYFRKLLYLGYHLGIGYDHDNHYTNFGRSNGGRLVVLAPSLTRANLISAMQQMHFYGSDDWNAKVDFTLNGNIMGSVTSGTVFPAITVVHNDGDGELADSIKIWRGNAGNSSMGTVIFTGRNNNTISCMDNSISGGVEYYYFAEIKQKDGQWIVTSPIWYRLGGPLAINQYNKNINFTCFPNPVSKNLSVSTNAQDDYELSIKDPTGRTVYNLIFSGKDANIDLAGIATGVYLLEIKSKAGLYSKKLVVE